MFFAVLAIIFVLLSAVRIYYFMVSNSEAEMKCFDWLVLLWDCTVSTMTHKLKLKNANARK